MGTTLTGTTPQDTYDSLIKVTDNGPLSGTAKYLSDGLGNDSALALSTGNIGIGTDSPSAKLDVSSTTATQLRVTTTSTSLEPQLLMIDGSGDYISIRKENRDILLAPQGAERMRITTSGNVGIQNSVPDVLLALGSTSSTVNVPAMKIFRGGSTSHVTTYGYSGNSIVNAVGTDYVMQLDGTEYARFTRAGLCFNGDFLAANALDDYEEGTWTPTMLGATFTLTTASGYYTKIGRQVSIWVECEGTYSSPTGAFRVSSLPFAQAGGRAEGIFSALQGISFGDYCSVETIGTTMYLESHASGTGPNRSDMNSTFFNAAGFRFMVSQTYFV